VFSVCVAGIRPNDDWKKSMLRFVSATASAV
jgi:hypothetical protein